MSVDSEGVLMVLLIFILSFVVGFALGSSYNDKQVFADCQTLGLHRDNNKVIECKVRP